MALGDKRRATSGARAPVDLTCTITGRERPEVGELDPLAALYSDVRAKERLRVPRRHQFAEWFLARKRP
jgi:hypothetical protein